MDPVVPVKVIDSHTEGEPTRVVIAGGPDLGDGPIADRLRRFRDHHDGFRRGVVCEPRGSEVVVGALLLEPVERASAAAVIFFNDVGYLGMCGHGTIGLVTTLAHLGRIAPGVHRIETPVGIVSTVLGEDGSVAVANVTSYRQQAGVRVQVPGYGSFVGDVAWGGNWFFLIAEHGLNLTLANRAELVRAASAVRDALWASGITDPHGERIDHVEFFSAPHDSQNSSRNFVLCPGASFDRSPCGTGTSAKLACLYADGKLAPGEAWRQEGILGTVFAGTIEASEGGAVLPTIQGRAWITGEATLLFDATDPFAEGIIF
jgi:4-hydroxyproline epimerase